MRCALFISVLAIVLSGCQQRSRSQMITSLPTGRAQTVSIARLSGSQLDVFVRKAIAVVEVGYYSQRNPDGSARDYILLQGYDRTVAPKCHQSSDGHRVYVTLTHRLSPSGLTGTLVHFEFDANTSDIVNATIETFVSDTF
jgi:hypothetical protein